MPVLEFRGISKVVEDSYVLDRVAFAVEKGEVDLLLAEDAGTRRELPHIIAGLTRPAEGKTLIGTRDAWMTERVTARTAGFILPGALPPDGTLTEILAADRAARHLEKVPDAKALARREQLFRDAELTPDTAVETLSPDARMRAAAILADEHRPSLYIVQDVFGRADAKTAAFMAHFLATRQEEGNTLFVIDHVWHPALPRPDRLQVLRHGRLLLHVLPDVDRGTCPVRPGTDLLQGADEAFYEACRRYQDEVGTLQVDYMPGEEARRAETEEKDRETLLEERETLRRKLKWPEDKEERP